MHYWPRSLARTGALFAQRATPTRRLGTGTHSLHNDETVRNCLEDSEIAMRRPCKIKRTVVMWHHRVVPVVVAAVTRSSRNVPRYCYANFYQTTFFGCTSQHIAADSSDSTQQALFVEAAQ
jgi:hypothetical protein